MNRTAETDAVTGAVRHRDFGIAIARAFDVLRCFSTDSPLLGNGEIAQRTGLAKATVSRLTFTLEELGHLQRVGPMGKYRLGWGLLSLSYPLLVNMPLRQAARPAMKTLADYALANVSMGTLDRLELVFVETTRFDESSTTRPDIGARRPLLVTAMGRALLFSLSNARRQALLNKIKVQQPHVWQESASLVDKAENEIMKKGYCVSRGEWKAGMLAIAAPVKVGDFDEPLAFNCVMPMQQFSDKKIESEIAPHLIMMVHGIEQRLGALWPPR